MKALTLAAIILAIGCITPAPAARVIGDRAAAAPVLTLTGATISTRGHDTWARFAGTFAPPASSMVPAAPGTVAPTPERKTLHLTGPVTLLQAWINASDAAANLTLQIDQDHPDYAWPYCDALQPANGSAECFVPFSTPLRDIDLNVSVAGVAAATYQVTIRASSAPLPILGAPVARGAWSRPVEMPPEEYGTGEPSVALSPDGTIYVAAPVNTERALWRSTDDGASFAEVPVRGGTADAGSKYPYAGGGDSEVAVASASTVYFIDQQGGSGMTVAASHDGGKTWTSDPLAAAPSFQMPDPIRDTVPRVSQGADRPWIVTRGEREAWMVFDDDPDNSVIMRTLDGGRSWARQGTAPGSKCGGFVGAPDGTLYLETCSDTELDADVSTDGGLTWSVHKIADNSLLHGIHTWDWAVNQVMPSMATDAKGNAYTVWSDASRGPGQSVWISHSSDRGATWSPAARVNANPGLYEIPWITAGANGRVAVDYYGTRYAGDPDHAMGEWYAIVATTDDALDAAPAWHEELLSPDPVHYGPICNGGSACGAGRELLDFFQVQADQAGRLHVAFVDGWAGPMSADTSRILYVHATGGQSVGGPSREKSAGGGLPIP